MMTDPPPSPIRVLVRALCDRRSPRYAACRDLVLLTSRREPAVAEASRVAWTGAVEAVPKGAAALVVCHGGGIEPGLVACLPDADHRSWGAPFGHCDSARLDFEDGRSVSVQFRRAPPRAELTP